ncbi:MAG TPA: hypothetical protein VGE32_02010, partial [Cellvibrio sp.]
VTSSTNFALLQTTAAANSSATLTSDSRVNYYPGQGASGIFTAIFTTGVANSTQIIGLGNAQDGFFFGYNGTSFGVMNRNNGVDTWIPQTTWNTDRFDGTGLSGVTLDPTKGNVYKIQYQWLGFGVIKFFIENPNDGTFVLAHIIRYPNANTSPSLLNPSLQLFASVANTTNTSNISLRNSSFVGFVEGQINTGLYNRQTAANFSVTTSGGTPTKSVTTTLNNILTIQNKATYQAEVNQVLVYPDELTIGNNTANPILVALILNPTVGGTPAFTDVSTNTSVVSFDTAGTTITGGKLLMTFFVFSSTSMVLDLTDFGMRLIPGDRFVVAARSTTGTNTVYITLGWKEAF